MANSLVAFVHSGLEALRLVDALWEHEENISSLRQISPKPLCLFIDFHLILHRLHKCLGICSGFTTGWPSRGYPTALPLVI